VRKVWGLLSKVVSMWAFFQGTMLFPQEMAKGEGPLRLEVILPLIVRSQGGKGAVVWELDEQQSSIDWLREACRWIKENGGSPGDLILAFLYPSPPMDSLASCQPGDVSGTYYPETPSFHKVQKQLQRLKEEHHLRIGMGVGFRGFPFTKKSLEDYGIAFRKGTQGSFLEWSEPLKNRVIDNLDGPRGSKEGEELVQGISVLSPLLTRPDSFKENKNLEWGKLFDQPQTIASKFIPILTSSVFVIGELAAKRQGLTHCLTSGQFVRHIPDKSQEKMWKEEVKVVQAHSSFVYMPESPSEGKGLTQSGHASVCLLFDGRVRVNLIPTYRGGKKELEEELTRLENLRTAVEGRRESMKKAKMPRATNEWVSIEEAFPQVGKPSWGLTCLFYDPDVKDSMLQNGPMRLLPPSPTLELLDMFFEKSKRGWGVTMLFVHPPRLVGSTFRVDQKEETNTLGYILNKQLVRYSPPLLGTEILTSPLSPPPLSPPPLSPQEKGKPKFYRSRPSSTKADGLQRTEEGSNIRGEPFCREQHVIHQHSN